MFKWIKNLFSVDHSLDYILNSDLATKDDLELCQKILILKIEDSFNELKRLKGERIDG